MLLKGGKNMDIEFKKCSVCGNIVGVVHASGAPIICCGKPMESMKCETTDGSYEKHVPVYRVEGNRVIVRVGEMLHPSTNEHYIDWVAIKTNLGNQRKYVGPNQNNEIIFPILDDEKVEAVYAYCNIHQLYKSK